MFRNYLRIGTRILRKNKIFSAINILGLSIGISAALVIFLVVQYDFSFEKFQQDGDRIFRVVSIMHFPDQEFKNSGVPGPLTTAIKNDVPAIESATAMWNIGEARVNIPGSSKEKKTFPKQPNIVFADSSYFKLFSYEIAAGSVKHVLNQPNQVILTESRAKLYFGDAESAIGKEILYNDTVPATVTAVVKDIQSPTDFTFCEFISLSTYLPRLKSAQGYDSWGSISSASQFFVKLKPGTDPKIAQKNIQQLFDKNAKDAYLKESNFLQPLRDIHFNDDYDNFDQRRAHKPTLYGLMAVGLFLLLLGCINFINLNTAQGTQRAKEIGIRKTMGSSRKQLVFQLLGETFFLTVLATLVSMILTPWILRIFSDFIPPGLSFAPLKQPVVIFFLFMLVVLVSLLSGLYPAMILSGYKPVFVLKNQAFAGTGKSRRVWVRKSLIISQFTIAQFFIIATLLVVKQIRFELNKDLGFKKSAIVFFQPPYETMNQQSKKYALLNRLNTIPGIEKTSLSGTPPATDNTSMRTAKFIRNGKEIETTVETKSADTNYLSLYHLPLIAGRNLHQSDTGGEYLVNEAYTKFVGFQHPGEIIGKLINNKFPVVGVVADFHSKSLQNKIQPVFFECQAKNHDYFHVALAPNQGNAENWSKTISLAESAWKEIYPGSTFSYSFVDDSIAKFYTEEKNIARLLNWSSGLTILISCLGLLGLVIFTSNQRTKEIGVRKVLGASIAQITTLLSKEYLRLVIAAFVIAVPFAWLALHQWLQQYAYRTELNWWIFIAGGLLMLVVAIITMSFQTIRAATENPVKSLRSE